MACLRIENLGVVSSSYMVHMPSIASPKRVSDRKPASPRQERPKVHATRSGVLYLDVQELFESEAGQRALEKAEKLESRLRQVSR